MKREGGWEAGHCSKTFRTVAIDVVCFLILLSSFLERIPFPFCKDQLIGPWYEKTGEAHRTVSRCEYWRTDVSLRY
jgi:hypothetical protein